MSLATTIVFIVWYSMPGLVGSSRFRIAEWVPSAVGLIDTVNVRGWFFGRAMDVVPPSEKVPSLPTRDTLYVVVPPPPDVRVNVYVRV